MVPDRGNLFRVAPSSCAKDAAGTHTASAQRGWEHALAALFADVTSKPSLVAYTRAVTALGAGCAPPARIVDLLRHARSLQLELDVLFCNKAVAACAKGKSWDAAASILDDMRRGGPVPDEVTCGSVVGACARCGRWDLALSVLEDMRRRGPQPNVIVCSAAVAACAKDGQWPIAYAILEEMRSCGPSPNVITFSSVISVCAKAGLWERALTLLDGVRGLGVEPDLIIYSAAMSVCEKAGRWELALMLAEAACSEGLELNEIAYNTAISACGRGAQWEKGLQFLGELRGKRVAPSVKTFSAAIRACQQSGQWEWAWALFSQMRRSKVMPDAMACATVLRACEMSESPGMHRSQHLDRCLQVVSAVQKEMLEPDTIIYGTVVNLCAQNERWADALATLGTTRAKSLQADVILHNTAISSCEKGLRWEDAGLLLHNMVNMTLQADLFSYSAAASAFEKGFEWQWALFTVDELQQKGVTPRAIVYNSVVTAFDRCADWAGALAHLVDARRRGLADTATSNAALGAHARANNWAGALVLLEELEDCDTASSAEVVEAAGVAMMSCYRSSAWQHCLTLFRRVQGLRVNLGLSEYACALRACGCGGRDGEASDLLAQMSALGMCDDSKDDVANAAAWAFEASGMPAPPRPSSSLVGEEVVILSKEEAVFRFVQGRVAPGDAAGVCSAIEEFARERQWLKIQGGTKARLLDGALLPADRVVELGTYVGYSALRLVRAKRRLGGGGRVISCEVSAANARVARAVIAWAGAEGEAFVRVGCGVDWLGIAAAAMERSECQERCNYASVGSTARPKLLFQAGAANSRLAIDVLLLDHRGTIYHEDLGVAEAGLAPGARAVADNTLHPGAPLFLHSVTAQGYDVAVHEVPEFEHDPPLDDWVVIASSRPGLSADMAQPPSELRRWSAEIDVASHRSYHGESVDWRALQHRIAPRIRAWRSSQGF